MFQHRIGQGFWFFESFATPTEVMFMSIFYCLPGTSIRARSRGPDRQIEIAHSIFSLIAVFLSSYCILSKIEIKTKWQFHNNDFLALYLSLFLKMVDVGEFASLDSFVILIFLISAVISSLSFFRMQAFLIFSLVSITFLILWSLISFPSTLLPKYCLKA